MAMKVRRRKEKKKVCQVVKLCFRAGGGTNCDIPASVWLSACGCSVDATWPMDAGLVPPQPSLKPASVPALVLIVPPVEVDVESHDAAGHHARDQSPAEETGRHKEACKFQTGLFLRLYVLQLRLQLSRQGLILSLLLKMCTAAKKTKETRQNQYGRSPRSSPAGSLSRRVSPLNSRLV